MRLLSDGINENTRLLAHGHVTGDKACIACGNCVDACPVVEEKHGFIYLPNQRTSMALEHMVDLECRRCYRCINSCPQVDKPIKEYAASFRRGEKIVHMLVALLIILLAASGIILSHYRSILPSLDVLVLDLAHRVLGVVFLAVPVLYFLLDRKHLVRWLSHVFRWRAADRRWIGSLFRYLKNAEDNPRPYTGEFNPVQKAWYVFITLMIPLMAVTGLILIFGFRSEHTSFYANVKLLHISVAFVTDMLLFIHIYIKYLRKWGLKIYALLKSYKDRKHLNYYIP
jgi:cytochrome b subunit of formate dehydrogenase